MGLVKTVVHVNQHKIKSNTKNGTDEPVLTVKTYKSNDYAHEALIHDAQGNVVAKVVSRPHDPLSCGARVWIEAVHPVSLVTDRAEQGPVSDDVDVLAPNPHDEPCPACNAEAGEDCRPGCLGEAAHRESDEV